LALTLAMLVEMLITIHIMIRHMSGELRRIETEPGAQSMYTADNGTDKPGSHEAKGKSGEDDSQERSRLEVVKK